MMVEQINVVSYEVGEMIIKLGDELTKFSPEWDEFKITKEIYKSLKKQKEEIDKE